MHDVPFITVEDDDLDLVVSFPLDPSAQTSLTLLRTPEYESLLDEHERGVTVSSGAESSTQRNLLLYVTWSSANVEVTSTAGSWRLSIARVDETEVADAKRVLKLMNFDNRFEIREA
jgi:hypothetical protein